MTEGLCVIVGVGEGNGAALARAFAREGMTIALLARGTELTSELARELGDATAYACDVADPEAIEQTFSAIRNELGNATTLVYNAGSGSRGGVDSISLEAFENAWRVNALGALAASQQVIPAMKAAGRGNIIFVGATASLRGARKLRHLLQPRPLSESLRNRWRACSGPWEFTSR